jgi:endogenous inhibitor of DNA gyrase (YacG/DUF329 family)
MSAPEKASQEKPCPICGKPAVEKYRPFCSSRCADVDLHRWLSGSYAIPAAEEDDEDGDTPPLAPDPPRRG